MKPYSFVMRAFAILVLSSTLMSIGCGNKEDPTKGLGEKPYATGPRGEKQLRFAFVTNSASTFWTIAEKGVRKAEKEFGVQVDVRIPPTGAVDEQQRIIEELIAKKLNGMAISPIDPTNMTNILNEAARHMPLITQDSDAPASNRLAYIGTDNYEAGRMAGEEIKKALPNGGKIMLFVGRLDAQNAQDRKRGIQDSIQGTKVEILDTRVDGADQAKAKQNAEDAIAAHPEISALVGLWSYNGPAILGAVRSAGKIGQVKIVCFDEETATLQGVKEGEIEATVVQKPFEFGYQSVRLLTELANLNTSRIASNRMIDTGVTVVNKGNVVSFMEEIKSLTQ